jgi:hypothetical protein
VLLHDGTKLLVERSQIYGRYLHPASREREVAEEEWAFKVPGTDQTVVWKTGFRRPPEGPNLTLLMLNFRGGVPYLATRPAGCIAYNYWSRPNPPYVFFKSGGKEWQRIPPSEFPLEFKETNVVVGTPSHPKNRKGTLSIAVINEENRLLERHLRVLARQPIEGGETKCEELIYYKGAWISPKGSLGRDLIDRITKQPSSSDRASPDKQEGGR